MHILVIGYHGFYYSVSFRSIYEVGIGHIIHLTVITLYLS
jgi:hypothetical protein